MQGHFQQNSDGLRSKFLSADTDGNSNAGAWRVNDCRRIKSPVQKTKRAANLKSSPQERESLHK